jgi:hypothetical protein
LEHFQGFELEGGHLLDACIATADSVDHAVHSEHVLGVDHADHVGDAAHLLTAAGDVVEVVLLAFALDVALAEEGVDSLVAGDFLQQLLFG